jgi:hypothetical protein
VLADVDPCRARNCAYSGAIGQRAVLDAWCGAAFATDYGSLGAWITTGGGHGDYFGNEVYAFELDSLRWVRINDPHPGGPRSQVDYDEGEYAPGIPLSSHTYQHTQYLGAAEGGGSKGSLILVVAYAAGRAARGSGRAHACDLATGRWSRYSANKATVRIDAMSATAYDASRKVFWRVPYGGAKIEYLASTDRRFHVVTPGSAAHNNFALDHVCVRDPVRDLLVVLDWGGQASAAVWALNLRGASGWRQVPTSGPAPTTRGLSIEWCPPLGCAVCYEGGGAPFVRKLFPPATDPLANAWRWEVEELAGDAPIDAGSEPNASYSRFRWAPAARCFVWADGHDLPVQAWRLGGT